MLNDPNQVFINNYFIDAQVTSLRSEKIKNNNEILAIFLICVETTVT